MIISKQNNDLVLVRQDDHMLHAGEITKRWGNESVGKITASESVIRAISEHDIGWKKPDDEFLFNKEKGQPINFIDVDLRQHVDFYKDGYKTILEKDKYAGMLIGMHWIGLYTSRFGYDPTFTYKTSDELVPFMHEIIAEQEKEWIDIKQEMWSHDQARSKFEDKIWMHYELFQLMDRLSLFMCLNDLNQNNKVTLGPVRFTQNGGYKYLNVESNGHGEVLIDQFPFDEEFDVSVPFRRMADKRYSSKEHALEEFNLASKEILNCRIIAK